MAVDLLAAAEAVLPERPDLASGLAEHVMAGFAAVGDSAGWLAAAGVVVAAGGRLGDGRRVAVRVLADVPRWVAAALSAPAAHRLRVELALLAAGAGETDMVRRLVAPVLDAESGPRVHAAARIALARSTADPAEGAAALRAAREQCSDDAAGRALRAEIALVSAAIARHDCAPSSAFEFAEEGLRLLTGGASPAGDDLRVSLVAESIAGLLDAGDAPQARARAVAGAELLESTRGPRRQRALLRLTVASAFAASRETSATVAALSAAAQEAAESDAPDLESVCRAALGVIHEKAGRLDAALAETTAGVEAQRRDRDRAVRFADAVGAVLDQDVPAAPEPTPPSSVADGISWLAGSVWAAPVDEGAAPSGGQPDVGRVPAGQTATGRSTHATAWTGAAWSTDVPRDTGEEFDHVADPPAPDLNGHLREPGTGRHAKPDDAGALPEFAASAESLVPGGRRHRTTEPVGTGRTGADADRHARPERDLAVAAPLGDGDVGLPERGAGTDDADPDGRPALDQAEAEGRAQQPDPWGWTAARVDAGGSGLPGRGPSDVGIGGWAAPRGSSGTGSSAPGASVTSSSAPGPSAAGASVAGPSAAGASVAGPSAAGPSGTGPSVTGPSGTGSSGTGSSGTGPSGTGPSAAGRSAPDPSATGSSATDPSATEPPATEPPADTATGRDADPLSPDWTPLAGQDDDGAASSTDPAEPSVDSDDVQEWMRTALDELDRVWGPLSRGGGAANPDPGPPADGPAPEQVVPPAPPATVPRDALSAVAPRPTTAPERLPRPPAAPSTEAPGSPEVDGGGGHPRPGDADRSGTADRGTPDPGAVGCAVVVDLARDGRRFAGLRAATVIGEVAGLVEGHLPQGARQRFDEPHVLALALPGWTGPAATRWMYRSLPGLLAGFTASEDIPGVQLRATVHDVDGPVGAQLLHRIDVARPAQGGRHGATAERSAFRSTGPVPRSAHPTPGGDAPPAAGRDRRAVAGAPDAAAESPQAHKPFTPAEAEGLGLADLLAGALAAYRSI